MAKNKVKIQEQKETDTFKDFPRLFKTLFALILLLAFVLIFFRLTRPDMMSDDAHYSFRSIFYLDFLASQKQTVPLQWFGEIPAWSKLSFHDAPPMVFFIQHAFFKTFGVNAFAAKLPFALAGMISLVLVFLFAKDLYSPAAGLFAALFLTVNNYFIWISRVGYLEGITLCFIFASLYFLIKSKPNVNYIFLSAVFLGFAFLSKYTSFYLIPFFLVYIFWQRRDLITGGHKYKLLASAAVVLVMFAPVIIYNVMMFKTRGHFDMQFAALFGQSAADWPIIERQINGNFLSNPISIFKTLSDSFSLPAFAAFIAATIFLLYEGIIFKIGAHSVILLNLLFLTAIFVFIGSADRYLALYAPFFAIAAAYSADRILNYFKKLEPVATRAPIFKYIFLVGVFVFTAYQLIFAVNTNHLYKPFGKSGIAYSPIRIENAGFKQLDEYLDSLLKETKADPWAMYPEFNKLPKMVERSKKLNSDSSLKSFSSLILYDLNMDWFGRTWVFEKRRLASNYLFFSFDELALISSVNKNYFKEADAGSAYIILSAAKNQSDSPMSESFSDKAGHTENYLKSQNITPIQIIRNPAGEEAFLVYFIDDYQKLLEVL